MSTLFNVKWDKLFLSSFLHSKTPHVVTVLWLDSDDVVTILSSTRNLVEGYKTNVSVPPWFLHSDCV